MSRSALGRVDPHTALVHLRRAGVNYSVDQVRRPEWHFDVHRTPLPSEPPGPPTPGGVWDTTRRLSEQYEFCVPGLVRAVYDPAEPLLGRSMMLQARFYGLHFYCGVRVTGVVDETRGGRERVRGWAYETLEGHLERGRVAYEVVKDLDTGGVQFVVTSYSQGSPGLGPVVGLGWRLFGRRTQLRFYRGCGDRMRRLVQAAVSGAAPVPEPARIDGLVLAPSDAEMRPIERLAIHRIQPGAKR